MKKAIIKTIQTILLVVFFTAFASAAITTTNPTLTGFIDENLTGTITITNSGSDTVDNLDLTTSGFAGYSFIETTALSTTTLVAGATTTYQFTVTVPESEAIYTDTHSIGTITFTAVNSSGNSTQSASTVSLDVKPRIFVDKVKIEVDGDSETVSEGEKIDAKRGNSITIEIDIENDFSSSTDIDFNNLDVTIESNNLDIDEYETIDVDAGDEETIIFDFSIDDDQDEGNEDVIITLEGYDDNDVLHKYIFEFTIDVDVPSREVIIDDAYFSPSIIRCDLDTTLNIDLKNTGENDLDEAMIIVESDDNLINDLYSRGLKLDEGEEYRKSIKIQLPEDTEEGFYTFYVSSYYGASTSDDSDEMMVTLEVVECIETTSTDDSDDDDTPNNSGGDQEDIVIQTTGVPNMPTGAVYATPKSSSLFDMDFTSQEMLLLLIVNIVVLAAVIMVVVAMKK